MENAIKKKELSESELINEGKLDDLVSGLKDVVGKMSEKIKQMAETNPEVKKDLEKAAKKLNMGDEEEATLDDLDNAVLESFLKESKGLLTEGTLGKIVGRVMQALGLGSLAVSLPAFLSMLPGWSDFQWTTNLHLYMNELCGSFQRYCGALTLLAVGLSVFVAIRGVMKVNRS